MKNYLADMLYALTSAYTRKDYDNQQQSFPVQTNIGKLFSIFAWGLDIVQENAELVKLCDDIDQARGAVLDRYGANWGVKRFNENDALYRLAIIVKIMSQLSGGDTDTIIRAAAELLGVENHDIDIKDVFPAKIALYVDWMLLTQERQELIEPIAWAIKRIVADGIGMRLYVRTYRTYRYDLLVKRGGAIGTFFHYDPVGENRLKRMDLFIAHSGSALADFPDVPTVGDDKTFSRLVFVAHAATGISDFSDVPPVSEDKLSLLQVFVAHEGISEADFPDVPPIGRDIASPHPVSVAHASYAIPAVAGAPPDSARVEKMRQSGIGGAYTYTHIKPKRID